MNNLEQTIDRAVEIERDADIDALSDAALLPFQMVEPEQDIFDLAVILAGLRKGFDMPELIDFSRGSFGKAQIHVTPEWFDATFAGNASIVIEPKPQFEGVRKSIDYEGVDIYCWTKARFVMEAV